MQRIYDIIFFVCKKMFFYKTCGLRLVVRTPGFHPGNRGSTPLDRAIQVNGRIAQLGEHLPYKQGVIGSSPIVTTILWRCSSAG